jgi:hypothetical protein
MDLNLFFAMLGGQMEIASASLADESERNVVSNTADMPIEPDPCEHVHF